MGAGFLSTFPLSEVESGRANNLNLIRMLLASSVILSHAYPVAGRMDSEPMVRFSHSGASLGDVAVIGFFFLSGYLIWKSALRRADPAVFLRARYLRIFPGLVVAVLLCIVAVGGGLTSLPTHIYLSNPHTYKYLLSVVLNPHAGLTLPGLFADHPITEVNLPLWTLSSEWTMYMVALVAGCGVHWRVLTQQTTWKTWLLVGGALLITAQMFPLPWKYTSHWAMAFLLGAVIYGLRRWILLSLPVAGSLFLLDLLLLHASVPPGKLLFPFAFCYLLLVSGFHPGVRVSWFHKVGDFSYGLYIYGWPVEQIVSTHVHTPLTLFLVSYVFVLPLAALSWYLVESPSLRWRRSTAKLAGA